MQQLCLSSINTCDYQMLTQILLNFPHFQELALKLTTVSQLIENIKYSSLTKNQKLYFENNRVYFFGQEGLIIRKQFHTRGQKIGKQIKYRDYINFQLNQQLKGNELIQIKKFGAYEQNSISSKSQGNYYIVETKKGFVLCLNLQKLSESLHQKISLLSQEKLKYLSQTMLLFNIEKSVLQCNLFRFEFLQIKFDEILYGFEVRESKTFLIIEGSIEIGFGSDNKNHCIKGKKQVLGLNRESHEAARCISEQLKCYFIDTTYLENILQQKPKNSLIKNISHNNSNQINPQSNYKPNHLLSTTVPTIQISKTIHINSSSNRRKILQQLIKSARQLKKQKQKIGHVRKYFSNFYNEAYTEFSQKKLTKLKIKEDDFNIFKMKILRPKVPNMNFINSQLKRMRIQRFQKCKENLIQTRGEQEQIIITHVENQKNSIVNSPRKNIKRQLIKTSCVSFNKYCSLHN